MRWYLFLIKHKRPLLQNQKIETLLEINFYCVAIGKPERHVHKASHCGSKQQQRSPCEITLLLLVRATYI